MDNFYDDFSNLVREVYTESPETPLFHYTSIGNFQNIIKSKVLFASEVRYFSDAGEMKYAHSIFEAHINQLLFVENSLSEKTVRGFEQFKKWLSWRVPKGHLLFIISFTANGNLLSQWRSYCKNGKGISFSFNPTSLLNSAKQQNYLIGRCIYDREKQFQLTSGLMNFIQNKIEQTEEEKNPAKRHPSESFYGVFEEVELDLLRIAVLFKSKHFSEEDEWRLISPHIKNYRDSPICFREGNSFLVPYLEFSVPMHKGEGGGVELDQIIIGPTPNMNISMNSISMFLAREKARYKNGLENCGIPYRTW